MPELRLIEVGWMSGPGQCHQTMIGQEGEILHRDGAILASSSPTTITVGT